MPVAFGLSVFPGPDKGRQPSTYMDDLDFALTRLRPYIKSLWVTDHFFWLDNPTHEAWTLLTFLAARYPDYQIGPIVLGQSYRNPAMLAKMGATLQVLSGGRFVMGIGAGWKEDEYHAYNYPYPRPGIRIEQLEDTLEIMTRLWKESGAITYHGKHYQIENAYCDPKPDPLPLILVGGGGEKTMLLAARFADICDLPDKPLDIYAQRLAILQQHCERIGRDFASLRRTWFGRLAVAPTEAAAEALSSGKWTRRNALCGTPAQVIEQVQAFAALGVDTFMCEIQGQANEETLALLKEQVFPVVTSG